MYKHVDKVKKKDKGTIWSSMEKANANPCMGNKSYPDVMIEQVAKNKEEATARTKARARRTNNEQES